MNYTPIVIIALIIALIELIWLWTLVAHLKNEEIESTEKICWTVVLCVLNALGLLLYIIFGPTGEEEITSEEELKKAFNEGRR